MDLRHLRYFIAVAEELHFTRAAGRLRIAQPSLSHQVRELEEQLGVRLLDRGTRQVTLTEAGRIYLEEARGLLRKLEGARLAAQNAGKGHLGRLSVGFVGTAAVDVMPPLIRAFRTEFPGVTLLFQEQPLSTQVQAIKAGALDIGIVREPSAVTDLAAFTIYRDTLVLALPRGHRLVARRRVRISELREEPFVTFPRPAGNAFYDRIIGACATAGFSPRIVQEVGATMTMIGLVAAHVGVAVVPSVMARGQFDGVVYRDLTPSLWIDSGLIWSSEFLANKPTLQAFIGVARQLYRVPHVAKRKLKQPA